MIRRIGFLFGVFCLHTSATDAALVTYSFSGTITDIREGGQTGTPISGLGGIDVGDMFSGSFTYDTADASAGPALFFFSPTTTNTLEVDIDGNAFDTPIGSTSGLQVFNDVPSSMSATTDALDIFKGGASLPAGWSVPTGSAILDAIFFDFSGAALSDETLPTSFDPADWDFGLMTLRFTQDVSTPTGDYNNIYIEGTMNLTGVPEPSSLALCCCAAGLATTVVRRRRWTRETVA